MTYVLTLWLGLLVIEFDTLAQCAAARSDLIAVYAEKWGTEAIGPCERKWQ